MDAANGFHTIAIETGASNAANITEAMIYVLHRYQQAQRQRHANRAQTRPIAASEVRPDQRRDAAQQ
jgi:hypothetical protein